MAILIVPDTLIVGVNCQKRHECNSWPIDIKNMITGAAQMDGAIIVSARVLLTFLALILIVRLYQQQTARCLKLESIYFSPVKLASIN